MVRPTPISLCLLVLACLSLTPQSARAQGEAPSFDLRHFSAAPTPHSIFSVQQSDTLEHLGVTVRAITNYANQPLVGDKGAGEPIIDGTMTFDFVVGMGLFDIVDVAVVAPFVLLHDGQFNGKALDDNAVGDIKLYAKGRLLDHEAYGGVGLAGGLMLGIPVGSERDFLGDGFVTLQPFVVADYRSGPLVVASNLGVTLRETSQTRNITHGTTLDYSLGARYELVKGLFALGLEGFGAVPLSEQAGEAAQMPLEWLLGGRVSTASDIDFTLAGGGGLGEAVGNPRFRMVFGVEYSPLDSDRDDDGIGNFDDQCPEVAEDVDGHKDDDGCPDEDNDEDAILDVADGCPFEAEDMDGVADEDGCPDPDSDEDGLDDIVDGCPNEAEDLDGFEDGDGCPDADNDADGVADLDDGCPNEAEDLDGFEDGDGCPDLDNDGDGFFDVDDRCPLVPEDDDGFEDNDGCPEADNDSDGVLDAADVCSTEKETINGVTDEDGCPDKGKGLVTVSEASFGLGVPVVFGKQDAVLEAASANLLNQAALTILATPSATRVRVEGHVFTAADEAANMRLSQDRAGAVLDALVARGVAADRLEAVGYGATRALGKNKTKNTRIELVIVEP